MEVTESPERLVVKRQSLIPFPRTGKRSGGELDQVAERVINNHHLLITWSPQPQNLLISQSPDVIMF